MKGFMPPSQLFTPVQGSGGIAPATFYRNTENSNRRITEDGNARIVGG